MADDPVSVPSLNRSLIHQFRTSSSDSLWWKILAVLMLVTMATRFYRLHQPDEMCWDESHMTKFIGSYINRTYFFDTHPPLAKMVLALAGQLEGFNVTLDRIVEQHTKYGDSPYIAMRSLCTAMGALLVLLSFLTVWEMTTSLPAATYSATFLLFDNGMITLNRFILPDPPMLLAISASFYSMIKFQHQRHRAFTLSWWLWLSLLGAMLSAAMAIKFVGLFIVLVVGIRTITDLWIILGDLSKPVSYTLKHLMARAAALIVLPTVLYMAYFYVHLSILNRMGQGLEHGNIGHQVMSSPFQATLVDSPLRNTSTSQDVAFGSLVTIRSGDLVGAFLASADELYPANLLPNQQKAGTTINRDHEITWSFLPYDVAVPRWNTIEQMRFIRHGDVIRLEHSTTGKNLHSNKHSKLFTTNLPVSASAQDGQVNVDDIWQVWIDDSSKRSMNLTLNTRFRLVHYLLRCALTRVTGTERVAEWDDAVNYHPKLTCNRNLRNEKAVWYVETSQHRLLPNSSYAETYPVNFLQQFIESHSSMVGVNSILTPNATEVVSRPWMWPILRRGQFFVTSSHLVYLLGNPIVWWANCFFLVVYWILFNVKAILDKRRVITSSRQKVLLERTLSACLWLHLAWMLHYLPFWSMTRVLYFHHYFPAMFFSTMISGTLLNYFIESLLPHSSQGSNKAYIFIVTLILTAMCYSFYLFVPITYGTENIFSGLVDSPMHGRKWLSSWEF